MIQTIRVQFFSVQSVDAGAPHPAVAFWGWIRCGVCECWALGRPCDGPATWHGQCVALRWIAETCRAPLGPNYSCLPPSNLAHLDRNYERRLPTALLPAAGRAIKIPPTNPFPLSIIPACVNPFVIISAVRASQLWIRSANANGFAVCAWWQLAASMHRMKLLHLSAYLLWLSERWSADPLGWICLCAEIKRICVVGELNLKVAVYEWECHIGMKYLNWRI